MGLKKPLHFFVGLLPEVRLVILLSLDCEDLVQVHVLVRLGNKDDFPAHALAS